MPCWLVMHRGLPEGLTQELALMALFAGFRRPELRLIVRLGEEMRFKANETLVAPDERKAPFYVILEGRVQLKRGGQPISELVKGDFFGGPVLLGGWHYPPEVVALEATRCFVLTPWSFQSLTRLHPNLLTRIRWELIDRRGGPEPEQDSDYYADYD
jgi:CRP-like cAMP-binding protein